MASVLLVASGGLGGSSGNVSRSAALTFYAPVGLAAIRSGSTEAGAQVTAGVGTFSNLAVTLATSTYTAASTYNFRKGGVNGNQTVSVGAASTGTFTDATHSDSVSGDLCAIQMTGGTSGSASVLSLTVVWSAGTCPLIYDNGGTLSGSGTLWMPPIGGAGSQTSESSLTQVVVGAAGTFSGLAFTLISNTSANTTVTSRVNGVAGNQTVSVGANITGSFSDGVHTDTLAAGDNIGWQWASTGVISAGFSLIQSLFTPSATAAFLSAAGGTVSQTFAITRYYTLEGKQTATTTEASAQMGVSGIDRAFSNLRVVVPGNTVPNASTLTLRSGAASTSLAVSVTASTTGTFVDSTHTVSINAGSLVDYQLVTGAGSIGQNFQFSGIAVAQDVFTVTLPSTVAGTGTVQAPIVVDKPTPTVVSGTGTVQSPLEIVVASPTVIGGVGTVQAPNPEIVQIAIPDATLFGGGWKNELGSSLNIQTSIDELTPSDTDYITITLG